MTPEQDLERFKRAVSFPKYVIFLCYPLCILSLVIAAMTPVPPEFRSSDFADNLAFAVEIGWPQDYSPRHIVVDGETYRIFNELPERIIYTGSGGRLEIWK